MVALSLVLLCICLFSIRRNKGIDYLALFCMIWATVLGGASLKLYGMREYSLKTIIIFSIGIISFIVFFEIGKYGKFKNVWVKRNGYNVLLPKEGLINKKILSFFFLIVTLFVIYSLFRMMSLIGRGIPIGTIHAMYVNRGQERFYTISAVNQLNSKIIIPCMYTIVPISAYFLLFDFKRNRFFIVVGIMDIILYTVSTGSRLILVFFAVDIILLFPFAKIKIPRRVFEKAKKIGMGIGFFLCIILVYYTILRKGFKSDGEKRILSQIFGEIYKYITLCIPLSDHWFKQLEYNDILTSGKMSFSGILSLVEWFFAQFFRTGTFSFLDICRKLSEDIEIMQPIFEDAKCNAFVTFLFYFYADFRIMGIIVGSTIWGFVSGRVEKKTYRLKDQFSILFYLLFAQTITMSFIRWSFCDTPYVISFILLRIYFYHGGVKGQRNENIYNHT